MEKLSTRKAAKYLGLKKNTLEIYRTRGSGPNCFRDGKSVFYYKTDLDEYREKRALPLREERLLVTSKVEIDRELYRKAKLIALRGGMSFSKFVSKAIKEKLRENS